jgi:hypothetical protein
MSIINLNNYEAFLLDYMEGNLNEEQRAALMDFLEIHPEKKEELLLFEADPVLAPEPNKSFDKELLKGPQADSFDDLLIAHLEGLLTGPETEKTETLIKGNSKIRKDFELYKKTILKPDLSVVFTEKNKLKRNSGGKIRVLYVAFSAVAAGLLLLMFNNIFNVNYSDPIKTKLPSAPAIIESAPAIEKTEAEEQPTVKQGRHGNKKDFILIAGNSTETSSEIFPVDIKNNNESLTDEMLAEQVILPELNQELIEKVITASSGMSFETSSNSYVLTPKEFLAKKIKSIIGKDTKSDEKLTVWDIADAGSNEISKATGKDLKIKKSKKEDGSGYFYALTIGKFEFSTSK